MRHSSNRILKGSDVKVDGQFTLDVMQVDEDASKQTSTALVEPQVRIVQSESDFTVIEITCSCGESIHLRCEYAATKAPNVPSKNDEPKVANQEQ